MTPVSVVIVVHNRLALTRACLESVRATTLDFELCVVDNGSTDGTDAYFRESPLSFALRYERNRENVGLIRALNQGARLATGDVLCFLHNDTEMRDPAWLARLCEAVTGGAGLAGLYGVRRVRRDGRYVGRTIVHALGERRDFVPGVTEVAAVDGVCLCLSRSTFEAVRGFDEGYGFFHGYDRDLSFAVREMGRRCVVVEAAFVHRGGGTRTGPSAPVPGEEDLFQRRAALARFAAKWGHRLPSDVRTTRERLADWFGTSRRRPVG